MWLSYRNTPIITSSVFPFYICINNSVFTQSVISLYFAFVTVNGSIISIMFWLNPVENRNSVIHKVDGLSARYVLVNYLFYKIVIERSNLLRFLTFYCIMLYFFYLSYKSSSKNWCCKNHIVLHLSAHLFSIFCFLITANNFHRCNYIML